MEKILEIAASVTNIYSLSGLIIGVLLILFYTILKKDVFPTLTKALGANLIQRMMTYIFILALVAITFTFISAIVPILMGKDVKETPTDTRSKFDVREGWTLKGAIEEYAKGKGRVVRFNNCDGSLMNGKLKTGLVTGKDTTEVIFNLQYRLDVEDPKEIYRIQLAEEGRYDINCREYKK